VRGPGGVVGLPGSKTVLRAEARTRTRDWTGVSFSYFGPVEAKKGKTVLAALHSERLRLARIGSRLKVSRLRRVGAGLQRLTGCGE
jgi:hypothetical protein